MNRAEVGPSTREQNGEPHYSIQDAKPLGGASYITLRDPSTTLPTKK